MNTWTVEDFCTLPAPAQPPFRLMEFDELFRSQVRPSRRIDPARVEFTLANADGLHAAGLQAHATTKVAEIDARIDDLVLIRATLVTAMEAGCDDLMVCARTDNCPLPFTGLARP